MHKISDGVPVLMSQLRWERRIENGGSVFVDAWAWYDGKKWTSPKEIWMPSFYWIRLQARDLRADIFLYSLFEIRCILFTDNSHKKNYQKCSIELIVMKMDMSFQKI